jgi:hypothetical protein
MGGFGGSGHQKGVGEVCRGTQVRSSLVLPAIEGAWLVSPTRLWRL